MKLGNPNGAEALRRAGKGNAAAAETGKAKAAERAQALAPILQELTASGVTALGSIALALNSRGIKTARGKQWYKSSIRNLLDRLPA